MIPARHSRPTGVLNIVTSSSRVHYNIIIVSRIAAPTTTTIVKRRCGGRLQGATGMRTAQEGGDEKTSAAAARGCTRNKME